VCGEGSGLCNVGQSLVQTGGHAQTTKTMVKEAAGSSRRWLFSHGGQCVHTHEGEVAARVQIMVEGECSEEMTHDQLCEIAQNGGTPNSAKTCFFKRECDTKLQDSEENKVTRLCTRVKGAEEELGQHSAPVFLESEWDCMEFPLSDQPVREIAEEAYKKLLDTSTPMCGDTSLLATDSSLQRYVGRFWPGVSAGFSSQCFGCRR